MCAILSFVQNDGERQGVLNGETVHFSRQHAVLLAVILDEQQRGRGGTLPSSMAITFSL